MLFDFDGTLTKPGALDFAYLRRALECPPDRAILEYLDELADGPERTEKAELLDRHEQKAATKSRPNAAAENTIRELHRKGLKVGVFTRNSAAAVDIALRNFEHLTSRDQFPVFMTREQGPVKPHPDSVPHAAQLLGVQPAEVMVVGDHRYDIEAGQHAGSWTCFLSDDGEARRELLKHGADYAVGRLDELLSILDRHRPLAIGKLPSRHLSRLLDQMKTGAAGADGVVIGPRVGEDIAAVQPGADEVVVLKTDPITFATEEVGRYAVHVGANDLACSGTRPRWFLGSVLFPPGTTPFDLDRVFEQIKAACSELGAVVVGGHTEITEAVSQTVVTGTIAGSVGRDALIDKRSIRAGDAVVMTKSAGLEGTAILCSELRECLRDEGLSGRELERGASLVEQLSVVPDALLAARVPGVHGMHDVTEGGVLTALEELGAAGDVSLELRLEDIPIDPVTSAVCEALGLDPLGLIGSGSLLIAVEEPSREAVLAQLESHGVPAACIGRLIEGDPGEVRGLRNGEAVTLPRFEVDEIARLFSSI